MVRAALFPERARQSRCRPTGLPALHGTKRIGLRIGLMRVSRDADEGTRVSHMFPCWTAGRHGTSALCAPRPHGARATGSRAMPGPESGSRPRRWPRPARAFDRDAAAPFYARIGDGAPDPACVGKETVGKVEAAGLGNPSEASLVLRVRSQSRRRDRRGRL